MTTQPTGYVDRPTFAIKLKQLRQAHELTQEELAEASGLSTRLISDLERAVITKPRRDTIRMLADGFHLMGEERDRFVLIASRRSNDTTIGRNGVVRLPVQTNALIGREIDIELAITHLRATNARLLTFTGTGGVGKTRLAIETARQLASEFAAGTVFVDLAPISSTVEIWPAVAERLGIAPDADDSARTQILSELRIGAWLLVLDNLEHIPMAGHVLTELLTESVGLVIIATSRSPLRIRSEFELPTVPLNLPDPKNVPAIDALVQIPAVALLIDRARIVRPSFAVTTGNARSIAELVNRLDGLPLAIELIAPRLRVLAPDELVARMDRALPLLSGGAIDMPGRLQTMQAAIEWSYSLLTTDEQHMLRYLAVYVGGFTISAVEEYTSARSFSDHASNQSPTLDGFEQLVRQSLIQTTTPIADYPDDQSVRFRMLQTVREFALDRLGDAGESQDAYNLQAQWVARLAEESESELTGPQQHYWYQRLEREHENIRLAMRTAIENGQTRIALQIAGSMYRFWANRGYVNESRDWYSSVLALPGCDPDHVRGNAHLGAGVMDYFAGSLESAEQHTHEAQFQYSAVGYQLGVAHSFGNLGMVADAGGDLVAAGQLYDHALTLFRELGDETCIGYMLNNLGLVALDQGDYVRSSDLFREALNWFRRLNNDESVAFALSSLGAVEHKSGNSDLARDLFDEALRIRFNLGHQNTIAREFENFAELAASEQLPERAVTLLGVAARLKMECGTADAPAFCSQARAISATLRSELGDGRFSDAWEQGVSMGTEEAVAYCKGNTVNM